MSAEGNTIIEEGDILSVSPERVGEAANESSFIKDPFDEMLPVPEASEVSFGSYKELYEFAVSNGFSSEVLANIKARAEGEEIIPN